MSRPNPKLQTLMQRFGYHDPDLTTPAHDHLIFWVKEHIQEILTDFYPLPAWTASTIETQRAKAKERIAARIELLKKWKEDDRKTRKSFSASEYSSDKEHGEKIRNHLPIYDQEIARLKQLPDLLEPPVATIEVRQGMRDEYPVAMGDRNNSIVGFLDILVHCHIPVSLGIAGGKAPEYDYKRDIADWSDPRWSIGYTERVLGFEIKTAIPSYGELMRQVNTYRRYFHGEFVVVSPDVGFAEQIKAQGVRFVAYQGDLPTSGPRQASLL